MLLPPDETPYEAPNEALLDEEDELYEYDILMAFGLNSNVFQ